MLLINKSWIKYKIEYLYKTETKKNQSINDIIR